MIKTQYTCCFTGHRIIATEIQKTLPQKLDNKIRGLIGKGICDFICGGALGFDTLAAQTILKLREEFEHIRLILALPCKNQTRGWNKEDIEIYNQILKKADFVYSTSETYTTGCMMKRNRFMVDNSVACVFLLTNQRSGTYKTVEYALESGKELHNILVEQ